MMSISHTCSKTVAKVSINFSLVWMQLLIKGSVGGFHQLWMQDLLRGGFYSNIVREVCAKNLGPRPLLPKTMLIFERF